MSSVPSMLPNSRAASASAAAAGPTKLFFGKQAAAGDATYGEPSKSGDSPMSAEDSHAIRP